MYLKKQIGDYGEDLACEYLIKNNYKIIERNFRCKQGEIDIIAKDIKKNELVFIEVKTRLNFHFGSPAQSVNNIKQMHIINASKYYIYKKSLNSCFIRFDVIEVFVKNYQFKINHIKQVI